MEEVKKKINKMIHRSNSLITSSTDKFIIQIRPDEARQSICLQIQEKKIEKEM